MHQHPMLVSNLCYLHDGLQCSSLIVRVHDRDEHSLFIHCGLYRSRTDTPIFINWEIRDAKPMQSLKCAAGMEYGGMFRYLWCDMVALMAISKSYTTYCQVIAF